MSTTDEFTYPTGEDFAGKNTSRILNHDAFLFQAREGDFTYQHNSRLLFDTYGGFYDFSNVTRYNLITGLLMMAAAIRGTEAVAWIEHTSNWDGFVDFKLKDERHFVTTWADFHLVHRDGQRVDPMEPGELWVLDDPELGFITHLELEGGYLTPEDDEEWSDDKVVKIPLEQLSTMHVWFDT